MITRRIWLGLAVTALVASLAILLPNFADARAGFGGSFGSRGMRTYSMPPPSATAPGSASPITRSMTPQPNTTYPQGGPQYGPGRYYYPGGFMSGLFGGLLGAGIGGLLFGHGFFGGINGFGSVLGLLLQFGLIYLLIRFALGLFRSRAAPSYNGPGYSGSRVIDAPYAYVPETPARVDHGGTALPGSRPLELTPDDFNQFEALLSQVQGDWSRGDLASLRRHVTPEMLSYFSELLAANASRGRENHVEQVRLEQGDLSEAWSEAGTDYATVAMRFSLLDWTVDQVSGRVVEGDPARPTQATEIWTFMRARGGHWLLSAIQQA